jgi:hypothetical protein
VASSTYDMNICQDLVRKLGIILNFNNHTVTLCMDTIPIKDRGTLHTEEVLVEVYLASTEPKCLVDKFSRPTNIIYTDLILQF